VLSTLQALLRDGEDPQSQAVPLMVLLDQVVEEGVAEVVEVVEVVEVAVRHPLENPRLLKTIYRAILTLLINLLQNRPLP